MGDLARVDVFGNALGANLGVSGDVRKVERPHEENVGIGKHGDVALHRVNDGDLCQLLSKPAVNGPAPPSNPNAASVSTEDKIGWSDPGREKALYFDDVADAVSKRFEKLVIRTVNNDDVSE